MKEIEAVNIVTAKGVVLNLANLLEIREANISDDFAHQAAVYGWVGVQLADAEHEVSVCKAKREEVEAELDDYHREELKAEGVKFTEAVVRSRVVLDNDYEQVADALRRAEYAQRQLRMVHDALKMRSDMLIQLGAHMRAERDMIGMNMKADPAEAYKASKR